MPSTMESFEIESQGLSRTRPRAGDPVELQWKDVLSEERELLDDHVAKRHKAFCSHASAASDTGAVAATISAAALKSHVRPSHSAALLPEQPLPAAASDPPVDSGRVLGSGKPFSLAFSGGGVRGAAFQAGVLWRLAYEGRLQDVEYLVGVSGGGYLGSAFTSQCLVAGVPTPGANIRDWYLTAVARTICRMQFNGSAFVRDCCRNPCWTSDIGAGRLPRFLDIPALLVVLSVTLLVHPVVFMTCILVPFTFCVELFFGTAMRATFCHPDPPYSMRVLRFFLDYSPTKHLVYLFLASSTVTFFVFCIKRTCSECTFPDFGELSTGHTGTKAPRCAIFGHALNAFLTRFSSAMFLLIFFVLTLAPVQSLLWQRQELVSVKRAICAAFVHEKLEHFQGKCTNASSDAWCVSGWHWFNDPAFAEYDAVRRPVPPDVPEDMRASFRVNLNENAFLVLVAIALVAVFFSPVLGSRCVLRVVKVAGPWLLFCATGSWVQHFVIGPVTGNILGLLPYVEAQRNFVITWSLLAALVLLFFYDEIRSIPHLYYRRSLQQMLFANGVDHRFASVADNAFCPFLLLTGVSNDYMPPGSDKRVCELFFSALHCGGLGTGYIRTPTFRSLAKCTALTSAGCLDALSLSMTDTFTMRFWLEVLNLCWGDYVIFDRCPHPRMSNPHSIMSGVWERYTDRFFLRVASSSAWIAIYVLFNIGWHSFKVPEEDEGLWSTPAILVSLALTLLVLFIGLSFFSIAEIQWLSFFALSPVTRQIHQGLRHLHVGNYPPRMLYITDGGVLDCTGVGQLVWRRVERILLVFAAHDPNDELSVLRDAMHRLERANLASFYNPDDPRRGVAVLLDSFRDKKDMPCLHLGICYPEQKGVPATFGHLIVVKNRLPPRLQGTPVQPELTEQEILLPYHRDIGRGCANEERTCGSCCRPRDLLTDDLGTFNCCDCCNSLGMSCGPKFPHGSFSGYLYLTQKWYSSLVRLGFEASEEAVALATSRCPLEGSWEAAVRPTCL